jgi:hypothetical protein
MIKFFRHIGQCLLTENKFSKHLYNLRFWRNTDQRFATLFGNYSRVYWLVYVNHIFCFINLSIIKLTMRKIVLIFFLCFSIQVSSQEKDITFKEYSYTEFFKLIEKEKDTIFKLKDAVIRFKPGTDSIFIVKRPYLAPAQPIIESPKIIIDKHIDLKNVHFVYQFKFIEDDDGIGGTPYGKGVLHNIHFKKSVRFNTMVSGEIHNCEFDDTFTINNRDLCDKDEDYYKQKKISIGISIGNNTFNKGANISKFCNEKKIQLFIRIFYNKFHKTVKDSDQTRSNALNISINYGGYLIYFKNEISGNVSARISNNNSRGTNISENNYKGARPVFDIGKLTELVFNKNTFTNDVSLRLSNLNSTDIVDWNQFKNKFYSDTAFENYNALLPDIEYEKTLTDSFRTHYKEKIRVQNAEVYAGEAALKGILYRHYRDKFDMASANNVYINLKDFETRRLKYLYSTNPSFDTFFQWKVNQFLKVFSNYGTKPSKAIVFSVYVVFVFALIYLFFPNSWDKHGKNRIINRYKFFTKYMNQKAGIHEVYLEDQKKDLLEYHEFKSYMESSGKTIPKFFIATALPLYSWAISGTKLSALLLKRVDIMKGSWQDLPESKRIWKSILLVGAFLIAVVYDIFIKMLNALMLSINTFTTLGFGEIPIKGLPRYLAIIQGFIGWFMLTIFSVSLISQLLN